MNGPHTIQFSYIPFPLCLIFIAVTFKGLRLIKVLICPISLAAKPQLDQYGLDLMSCKKGFSEPCLEDMTHRPTKLLNHRQARRQ